MLTHQLVFGQMNGHDFKLEELLVPKAVGLACHGFDLVVGPFHDAAGDGEQPPGEQTNLVPRQRLAQGFELRDAGVGGGGEPFRREGLGVVDVLERPEV